MDRFLTRSDRRPVRFVSGCIYACPCLCEPAARRWTLGSLPAPLVAPTALTIVFDGIDNQLMGVTIPTITAGVVAPGDFGAGRLAVLCRHDVRRRDRRARRRSVRPQVRRPGSMVVFGGINLMAVAAADGGLVGRAATARWPRPRRRHPGTPRALAAEYVPIRERPVAETHYLCACPAWGDARGARGDTRLAGLRWRTLFWSAV